MRFRFLRRLTENDHSAWRLVVLVVAVVRERTKPDAEVQRLELVDFEQFSQEHLDDFLLVPEALVAGINHQLERQHVVAELTVPDRQYVGNESDFLQVVASGCGQSFSDTSLLLSDELEQTFSSIL